MVAEGMTHAAGTSKGVESSIKMLVFDRLSRTLVIVGCTLVGLGFMMAFIKNREALWFWVCTVVTVVAIGLLAWLASSDLHVRVVGMIFQLLGIAVWSCPVSVDSLSS
jgi:hypothetical protein